MSAHGYAHTSIEVSTHTIRKDGLNQRKGILLGIFGYFNIEYLVISIRSWYFLSLMLL